jgi:hypothetical protein
LYQILKNHENFVPLWLDTYISCLQ